MQQTLLRLGLPPGATVYASQFRDMLALQPGLANGLFHRDADGRTINERPGVRMAGAQSWVGIVADPGNEALLNSSVAQAICALNAHTGMPCKVEIENPQFGLTATNEPHRYYVREMAIKRRHRNARTSDLESLVATRVTRSIEAVCAANGLDCPPDDQLDVQVVEVIRPRGLKLQTSTGVTGEYVELLDAIVLIHADLKGYWFVGNLTSRGYGRIIRERPGMRFNGSRHDEVLR